MASFSQLEALWVEAGGPSAVAPVMAAIALAESSGNPNAVNAKDPGGSVGLWQINGAAWPQLSATYNLADPLQNAIAAVDVYRAQGLSAWSTYNNGAYAGYLQSNGGAVATSVAAPASVLPAIGSAGAAATAATSSAIGALGAPAAIADLPVNVKLALVAGFVLLVVAGLAKS